jgi:hypothetical protein
MWFNPQLDVEIRIHEQRASVIHTIFARCLPSRIEKPVAKVDATELMLENWFIFFLPLSYITTFFSMETTYIPTIVRRNTTSNSMCVPTGNCRIT